jgi:hypothetical protein
MVAAELMGRAVKMVSQQKKAREGGGALLGRSARRHQQYPFPISSLCGNCLI